jgi:hypothetical protein
LAGFQLELGDFGVLQFSPRAEEKGALGLEGFGPPAALLLLVTFKTQLKISWAAVEPDVLGYARRIQRRQRLS